MKVLAIDTATNSASVAVWNAETGALITQAFSHVTTHSEQLLPLIRDELVKAELELAEIGLIACGAGPGSFTGLRIGLGTAKGLCFATRIPLVLVSSLEAMAQRVPVATVCAGIDAYKSEVYAGIYRRQKPGDDLTVVMPDNTLPPADLIVELQKAATAGELALVGDAFKKYPQLLVSGAEHVDAEGPRGEDIAKIGYRIFRQNGAADLVSARPAYIRPSEPELVKQKKSR